LTSKTFKKSQRLLLASSYQNVFNNVEFKSGGKYLLFLACRNELSTGRLGLAISKKHLKKAVDRNRIKRLVRVSFQENQYRLQNLDIVVLLRNNRSALATNEQINQELEQLWVQLISRVEKSVLTVRS